MKGTYRYTYAVYTCNLCYGRMLLGYAQSKSDAENLGRSAGKGVFTIERKRICINQ